MARRRPSDPPILPGFSHIRMLGSGGFADVFLYEQNMPRRQVAVKVMLADVVTESVRQMFQVEANLMAQLSAHPSILTVYQASISADGRPYLVMELCSAQLAERFRRERMPVTEVLRIGVQIGSAVETAHRQGVLHRDIKPSNILTTVYGHPVLSDFGIAATLSAATAHDTVGMSIPWSAPEVLLDTTPGAVTSEVWSLAATVYSLLAGRSPFEIVDGTNTSDELIARITKAKLPAIGRDDVPDSLERMLRRGMSRDPGRRQQSAMEFVRELQTIELELGFTPTPADVAVQDWALVTADDPGDRTVVRAVAPASPAPRPDRRRRRSAPEAAAPASTGTGARRTAPRGRLAAGILVGSVLAVVGLGALVTVIALQGADGDLPRVTGVTATVDGPTVAFRWPDPGIRETDAFQVRVEGGESTVQRSTEFSVAAPEGTRVCLTVSVTREGRVGPSSAEQCAESAGG
ncbi:serine/threonine-protein kinase [Microcella daejeonensis]|uniref:non-specific serine/threonine protein kinase n=1 Tax=Microcella daejeonensis TaxID=2994971 RepID=A0A9E8MJZ7_9MICO|nr:serine/threonine-protein kinase [Microcella daejeonensis]WAB80964.1 serine/threonine-protein kinase [Microcella daejeonensis]